MYINSDTGVVEGVRFVPSPNFDERPEQTAIDLLVIHGISLPPNEFGGPYIDQLFTNSLDPTAHPYFEGIKQLQVSSHLLIRRDGEIVQYVSLNKRAWHAGKSEFCGRTICNNFSIGIELEGSVNQAYTDLQYRKLAEVIESLMSNYPKLTRDRIVGHSDIAPGRKTDPGPWFDWRQVHDRPY